MNLPSPPPLEKMYTDTHSRTSFITLWLSFQGYLTINKRKENINLHIIHITLISSQNYCFYSTCFYTVQRCRKIRIKRSSFIKKKRFQIGLDRRMYYVVPRPPTFGVERYAGRRNNVRLAATVAVAVCSTKNAERAARIMSSWYDLVSFSPYNDARWHIDRGQQRSRLSRSLECGRGDPSPGRRRKIQIDRNETSDVDPISSRISQPL